MSGETRTAAQVALAFLRRFWESDVDGALGYCAPGATWTFPRSLPYAREVPVRDALEAIRDDMFQAFDPEGFRIELRRELSVGDGAVVEYSAHGRTRDGRAYDNDYVMCITVRDERVTSVRPYTDTLHLTRVLMNGEQGDSP